MCVCVCVCIYIYTYVCIWPSLPSMFPLMPETLITFLWLDLVLGVEQVTFRKLDSALIPGAMAAVIQVLSRIRGTC